MLKMSMLDIQLGIAFTVRSKVVTEDQLLFAVANTARSYRHKFGETPTVAYVSDQDMPQFRRFTVIGGTSGPDFDIDVIPTEHVVHQYGIVGVRQDASI